jgi:general secretion pathway protein G
MKLAILSVVLVISWCATPIFLNYPDCNSGMSAVAAARIDMNGLIVGLRTFKGTTGRYPTAREGLQALVSRPPGLENWRPVMARLNPDPWRHPYQYVAPSHNGPSPFGIYSLGKDGATHSAGNDPDDISTWNEPSSPRRTLHTHRIAGILLISLALGWMTRSHHQSLTRYSRHPL